MVNETYFKEMYNAIWQGYDLNKFEDYYAKDFEEIISLCDDNKNPVDLKMNYTDLFNQVIWQQENYENTTLEIKKIVETCENHISVYFYSRSIYKMTKEFRHRFVCGIWRLNQKKQIDRVWAVVTPYYASK